MGKIYGLLKIAIMVLAFAVVLTGAYLLYNRLSSQVQLGGIATVAHTTASQDAAGEGTETQAEEEPAPDFTVYDREGNAVTLTDFRGKPVILNFWASWCGPCVSEMPDLQDAYDTYGEQIHFVLVNLTDGNQETVESATKFLDEKGYTFPVYFDTDIDAAAAYGVNAVPMTIFLDAQGYGIAWAQGAMSAEMIQQGVDMVLGAE